MLGMSVCLRQQIRGLQWTIRFNRPVFPIDPVKRPQDVPLILSPRPHGFVRLWSVRVKYSCVYVSSDTTFLPPTLHLFTLHGQFQYLLMSGLNQMT